MSITRDDTLNWVKAIASAINENRTYLTELDAAIGDADHGANMDRGFKAVMNKLPEISDKDIGAIFKTVGMKTAGKMEPSLTDCADALEAPSTGWTCAARRSSAIRPWSMPSRQPLPF